MIVPLFGLRVRPQFYCVCNWRSHQIEFAKIFIFNPETQNFKVQCPLPAEDQLVADTKFDEIMMCGGMRQSCVSTFFANNLTTAWFNALGGGQTTFYLLWKYFIILLHETASIIPLLVRSKTFLVTSDLLSFWPVLSIGVTANLRTTLYYTTPSFIGSAGGSAPTTLSHKIRFYFSVVCTTTAASEADTTCNSSLPVGARLCFLCLSAIFFPKNTELPGSIACFGTLRHPSKSSCFFWIFSILSPACYKDLLSYSCYQRKYAVAVMTQMSLAVGSSSIVRAGLVIIISNRAQPTVRRICVSYTCVSVFVCM